MTKFPWAAYKTESCITSEARCNIELFIIRHAESGNNSLSDNRDRVVDPPITELGRRQAEILAQHLATGTPSAMSRVRSVEIDREYRKKKDGLTPSDHAPVFADLD